MDLSRPLLLCVGALFAARAFSLSVTVQENSPAYCGQPLGMITANASGGMPPYTFDWSNGYTSTYGFMGALMPGTYTVTVTDALGEQATGQGVISNASSYGDTGAMPMSYCAASGPWFSTYMGTEDNPDPTQTTHGPGPYSFDASPYFTTAELIHEGCTPYSYYSVHIDAPTGTYVTVNYTDGIGCPGSFAVSIPAPVEYPTMTVQDIVPSCSNGAIGTATVLVPTIVGGQQLVLRLKDASDNYVGAYCQGTGVGQFPVSKTFTQLAPGDYEAELNEDLYSQYEGSASCSVSIPFTIPTAGTLCAGAVSGTLYVDDNANCSFGGAENVVPGTLVKFTPGPYYAVTNGYGGYTATLPLGTYTVEEEHPVLTQSCPLQITLSGPSLSNRNIACAPGDPLDVQLHMNNGAARPGFQLQYALVLDNLTASATGDVTLEMTFDPALGYLSSSIAPASVVGNTITWTAPNLTMLTAFAHRTLGVDFQVPPDVNLVGTLLYTTATVITTNTDADLTNNTVSSQQEVTASLDPNEKVASTGSHIPGTFIIDADEDIDYTLRFQNTGNDTAFTVVVTDTLPSTLDVSTVRMGAASHPFTWEVLSDNILRFTFANILLPDSNVNEAASHGFVGFQIKPILPLAPATEITNTANIFFDFNEPVITEPSVMTAEFSTGVAQYAAANNLLLSPNPVTDRLTVHISDRGFQAGQVRVLSMDGREVLQTQANGPSTVLDVAGLAKGLYIVEVRDARGAHGQGRLVKE